MLIPVNPEYAATKIQPLDDSRIYQVICDKFEVADEPDKNDNKYFTAQYKVITPEDSMSRVIFDSYIRFPGVITSKMSVGERVTQQNKDTRFWGMIACFKIKIGPEGFNSESMLGATGWVAIENSEFEGNITSKVKGFDRGYLVGV